MSEFDKLWKWARSRGMFQQEYMELKHIYDLMKNCDCQSYLEVGSAEGSSLYILGNTSKEIAYIDIDEDHTREARKDAIKHLEKDVKAYHGDSRSSSTHPISRKYDCVLIDGGHDYDTVYSDCMMYAPLATKYIFWHDIQLPEVRRAIDVFMARNKLGKYSTFINSGSYGYGIIEVGK